MAIYKNTIISLILTLSLCTVAYGGSAERTIQANNKELGVLFTQGKVDELVNFYVDEPNVMFELKPAIFNRHDLFTFYQHYFKKNSVDTYKKEILEVLPVEGYIIELGRVSQQSTALHNKKQKKHYVAKYLTLWQQVNGKYKIHSEIFNSIQALSPEELPYSDLKVIETKKTMYLPDNIDDKLYGVIERVNADALRAVNIGDPLARTDGFSDKVIVGRIGKDWLMSKDLLEPEIHKVYIPENRIHAWHRYYAAVDLGQYIFIVGHFKGGFGDRNTGGAFEGNFIILYEQSRDGRWRIFRELATNDRVTIQFKGNNDKK